MSLVDVYDALKEAKVSDQKAAAAVKAIETVREEARLRRIEESIAELRADMNAQITELRAEMEKRFGEVRADMDKRFAEMQGRVNLLTWMIASNIALTGGILLKLLS